MDPITREEKLMVGEQLEPITRKEMFLAKAAGMDIKTPEPITREEMFISMISGGGTGGSGPVIESLTVTENGTYNVPEGVDGYNPVTVEVASVGGDIDALIDGSITEITSYVETIRACAFYGSSADQVKLKVANFPRATKVKQSAFNFCKELTEINLPMAIEIQGESFKNCAVLKTVNIPKVKTISGYTFSSCSKLKEVDLPSVSYIVQYAFAYCSELKTLILRTEETVCELQNTSAFQSSGIKATSGYIYVPSALIEEYKVATNWVTFADRFRALEDYTVDGTTTGELDPAKTGVTA